MCDSLCKAGSSRKNNTRTAYAVDSGSEKSLIFDRDLLKRKAMKILSKKKYELLSEIGTGAYGDVYALWDRKGLVTVAAKVQHPQMSSKNELKLWPGLDHINIAPVLKVVRRPDVHIFLMPYYPKNLINELEDCKFRSNPKSFDMTLGWIADAVSGLEYLHNSGVCHLDLKADNILITSQNSGVICDFSTLETTKELTESYALPRYYCPPEAWPLRMDGPSPKVDGRALDVWSVGMLFFYCVSNRWMETYLWGQSNWWSDIYPLMSRCFEYTALQCLMRKSFPLSDICLGTCSYALNFLKGILRYRAQDRPSPAQILRHVLLPRKGNWDLLEPDSIWTYDTKEEVQRLAIKYNLNIIYNTAVGSVENVYRDKGKQTDQVEVGKESENVISGKGIRSSIQETWKVIKDCTCCKR